MSDETPKITCQTKTKDPRRVEASRRLAALSKQAKEKKAKERFEAEQREQSVEAGSSTGLLAATIFVVVLGGVYLAKKKGYLSTPSDPPPPPEPTKTVNFISFDE